MKPIQRGLKNNEDRAAAIKNISNLIKKPLLKSWLSFTPCNMVEKRLEENVNKMKQDKNENDEKRRPFFLTLERDDKYKGINPEIWTRRYYVFIMNTGGGSSSSSNSRCFLRKKKKGFFINFFSPTRFYVILSKRK